MNYDYIMGWETDNEEGLRGAWDIEQRDKELDADGVTAEVMFADADAITGMASPPFGAGLSAGAIADPELAFAGARAHNRFLAEMCARSPERHGGIALVPITHGVERSVGRDRVAGRAARHPGHHGADHVARPRALQPPQLRPGVGGLPGGRASRCTPTRARRPRTSTTTTSASTWPRWCGGRPGRCGTSSSRASSSASPASSTSSPRRPPTGRADMMWKWDQYMGGGHTTKKMAALLAGEDLEASVRLLRGEHLHRRLHHVEGGDPPAPRARLRRRHVGHRLPAPRGDLAAHPGALARRLRRRSRSRTPRQLLGETAARCYGFDLEALRPIAERIGPTPAELGQDPSLRTDPAEVRAARWWKDEYQVKAPG